MKNQVTEKPVKVVFFGTPDFAVPALKYLVDFGYDVIAVVTQPEKPVGRAKVVMPSPIKKAALEMKIEVLEPHNLKQDAKLFERFKHLNPDICVVAAYGKIIPPRYLEIPKYGFVNIHPSLLPKYRGPSPIQTAILNGDNKTGVSIIVVDNEVDHGPLLAQQTYNLQPKTYNIQTSGELFALGAKLLIETLPKYINGDIKPQEQDHSQATFTKMLSREDGRINWSQPAEKIYNQIRALNPEPGTWSLWKGKVVNIKKAKLTDDKLEIETLQLEGKRETPLWEFLNGHRDFDISQLK